MYFYFIKSISRGSTNRRNSQKRKKRKAKISLIPDTAIENAIE